MLTILAFFTMLLQFYITRVNTKYLKSHKMSKVSKWHKALGYIFIPVLILHRLLIVFPRGLEGGISPIEALIEIIANFDNTNLLLGLLAWLCMIGIGITAFLRFRI